MPNTSVDIVLDASVVIAHFSASDSHHDAGSAILAAAVPGRMIMHPLTIAEVLVGAVRQGLGQAVSDDLRAMGIRMADTDVEQPLRLATLRASTRLRLPDCCVLDVAIQAGAEVATFDTQLAAAARDKGLTLRSGTLDS